MAGGAQGGKSHAAKRHDGSQGGAPAMEDPTAAVLVIGDEILSGSVEDTNSREIARFLAGLGVQLDEIRVVADDLEAIARAVNELRARHDVVITTGGIGPTHDDVTTDAVARAFGVPVVEDAEAAARLRAFLRARGRRENAARMRMARVPQGAALIDNPVSAAPGYRMDNVYVLAGVPRVMRAMLETMKPLLRRGRARKEVALSAPIPEGELSAELADIAKRHPRVSIGSYPSFDGPVDNPRMSVRVVVRSADEAALEKAAREVDALLRRHEHAERERG